MIKILDSDTPVMLMQPKEAPVKFLTLLSDYFRKRCNIEAAYFSLIQFMDRPNFDYLIAICAKENVRDEVVKINEFLSSCTLYVDDQLIINIVDVNKEPLESCFFKIMLFYSKVVH